MAGPNRIRTRMASGLGGVGHARPCAHVRGGGARGQVGLGGGAAGGVQAPGVRSDESALRDRLSRRSRDRGRGQWHTLREGNPMSGERIDAVVLWSLLLGIWIGALASVPKVQAHESRPAYLEINETSPGRY